MSKLHELITTQHADLADRIDALGLKVDTLVQSISSTLTKLDATADDVTKVATALTALDNALGDAIASMQAKLDTVTASVVPPDAPTAG